METNRAYDLLLQNQANILYFKNLMIRQNLSLSDILIVLANTDKSFGMNLAKLILPGFNWQAYRNKTGDRLALGLVSITKIGQDLRALSKTKPELTGKAKVLISSDSYVEIFHI